MKNSYYSFGYFKRSIQALKSCLLIIFCFLSLSSFAETIKLKITYNGAGVAGHTVVVMAGISAFGQGVTDSGGNVNIKGGSVSSKTISLAGVKITRNGKKEWRISGMVTLDDNNFAHVKMDEIIAKMDDNKSTAKLIAISWGLVEASPQEQKKAMLDVVKNEQPNMNKEINNAFSMLGKRSPKKNITTKSVNPKTTTSTPAKDNNTSIVQDIQSFSNDFSSMKKDALLMQQQSLQGKVAMSDRTIRKRTKHYNKLKEVEDVDKNLLRLAQVELQQAKTRKLRHETKLKWVNARLKGKVSRAEKKQYKKSLSETDDVLDKLKAERKELLAKKKPEEFTRFGLKRKIAQLNVTLKRKQFSRKTTFRRSRKVVLDKEIASIKARLKKYKAYLAEQRAIEAAQKQAKKKAKEAKKKKSKEKAKETKKEEKGNK